VNHPVVSILALCFNHEKFLDEALLSIENLTYPHADVWVVDDASSDSSPEILRRWKQKRPDWHFVLQEKNLGNCRTFNQLLHQCSGKWVIDFATDDLLEKDALQQWVARAESAPDIGFCYADGIVLDQETGKRKRFSETIPRDTFPEGKILPELLSQPFICPPAVLFNKEALLNLGGYDENLHYEDWDAWLRISHHHPVLFHPEPVITYRKHSASMSASLLLKRNRKILQSTIKILERIEQWPEFRTNPGSMAGFTRYHLRMCFGLQLPEEARLFYQVLERTGNQKWSDTVLYKLAGSLPFMYPVYKAFRQFRTWMQMREKKD